MVTICRAKSKGTVLLVHSHFKLLNDKQVNEWSVRKGKLKQGFPYKSSNFSNNYRKHAQDF